MWLEAREWWTGLRGQEVGQSQPVCEPSKDTVARTGEGLGRARWALDKTLLLQYV